MQHYPTVSRFTRGSGRRIAFGGFARITSSIAVLASVGVLLTGFTQQTAHKPPAPGGYFSLVPAGQFSSLPSDAQAAAKVHLSPWEPRPRNKTANHTVPPAS